MSFQGARRPIAMLCVAMAFVGLRLAVRYGDLIDASRFLPPRETLVVTDRDGRPLRVRRQDGVDRQWVRYEALSPHLIAAFLAAEDDAFFDHPGIDATATARGVLSLFVPGMRRSGGSTLSQQTVKLTYGRPHGLWDKPMEMLRALALEEHMGKEAIFEQYVNRVPYGDRIVGVGRASEAYFGKAPSELNVGEAALLAAIPQAPSINEPRRHRARAERRRRYVLDRMLHLSLIDASTHRREVARFPNVLEETPRPWHAPRFVDRVLAAHPAGGASLRTTLHRPLQRGVRRRLLSALERLRSRGVENGAAMVLATQSAEVLAYVGAADRNGPGGALDLLRARRQPGSSLKPFIFAFLFEGGGGPATWLDDVQREMTGQGTFFHTENYDGVERGPVLAREALAGSLNLAAIDAARRVGPALAARRLGELGFSLEEREYGAAIALGGIDVSPFELARAMATLQRGGNWREPRLLADERPDELERRIEADAAELVVHILRDGRARASAFGDDLEHLAGDPFALKTGTSSGWNDAWSVAMDAQYTVVVWLGDPSGQPLLELSGFEGAAPVAASILGEARDLSPIEEPELAPQESALERASVCTLSGARPGPHCPHARIELFQHGHTPHETCGVHTAAGLELPGTYDRWLRAQGRERATQEGGELRLAGITDGSRLLVERGRAIPLRLLADGHAAGGTFYVNGQALERWVPEREGAYRLRAVADGRTFEAHVHVRFVGP